MKLKKVFSYLVLSAVMMLTAFAAVPSVNAATKKGWKVSNEKVKYYKDGKAVKGLQTINDKTYYFDNKGVQRTSWRLINDKYYYFYPETKAAGYMAKNTTINGVKLKKNGSAKLTSSTKRKVKLMVRCSELLDKIVNPAVSKSKKLRAAFIHVETSYPYVDDVPLLLTGDYDMFYAEKMLDRGYGECFCCGCLFGYLANAIGYKNVYFVCSDGHGWTEIGDLFYDANYASVPGMRDKCYGATASESGRGGRPDWARGGFFRKRID